jgi:hypothetical protein
MDRNNYIEIHPTQAQVAKISYPHPSKYLNQNVSPSTALLPIGILPYSWYAENITESEGRCGKE